MTIYARRRLRRRLNRGLCVFVRIASSSRPVPLCDFVSYYSYFQEKKSLQTDSSEKIANLPGSFLVPLRKKLKKAGRDKLPLLQYMYERALTKVG